MIVEEIKGPKKYFRKTTKVFQLLSDLCWYDSFVIDLIYIQEKLCPVMELTNLKTTKTCSNKHNDVARGTYYFDLEGIGSDWKAFYKEKLSFGKSTTSMYSSGKMAYPSHAVFLSVWRDKKRLMTTNEYSFCGISLVKTAHENRKPQEQVSTKHGFSVLGHIGFSIQESRG